MTEVICPVELAIRGCLDDLAVRPLSLHDRRDARLSQLLHHHFENEQNGAWRRLLNAHGICSASQLPRRVDSLTTLPIVTKNLLREANYAEFPAVQMDEVRLTVSTSGSMGAPLAIPQSFGFSRRVWGEMFVRTLALVQDAEICRSPGYVVCHQTKDLRNTGSFAASSYLCGMLGSHVVLGLTISPPEHHAKLIKEHGIKWIASSPGFFVALSAWSAANDRVLQSSGLEVVHAAGAPIDDTLRLRVMDELGLRSFHRAYASTELGFVGVACSSEAVYTMFSDEYVFEIVDDDGEHVMPGQRGRVLVTVLSSDAAPLIRYENGDTARYVGDTCPATGFAVLDKIGRRLTAILCDAKVTYDDIAAIPDVMSQRGVVTSAFQLAKQREPDGRDRICIRVETDIADHAEVHAAALLALRRHPQLDYHLSSGELAPLIVDVFGRGQLLNGRFKLPLYVDEADSCR